MFSNRYKKLSPTEEADEEAYEENFSSSSSSPSSASPSSEPTMSTPLLLQADTSATGAHMVSRMQTGLTPIIGAIGHFVPPVGVVSHIVSAVMSQRAAMRVQRRILRLQRLSGTVRSADVRDCIDYAIGKLNARLLRHNMSSVPYVATAVSCYNLGNALKKHVTGTLGVERMAYAELIYEGYRSDDPEYTELVEILCTSEEFNRIRGNGERGEKIIARTLSSMRNY